MENKENINILTEKVYEKYKKQLNKPIFVYTDGGDMLYAYLEKQKDKMLSHEFIEYVYKDIDDLRKRCTSWLEVIYTIVTKKAWLPEFAIIMDNMQDVLIEIL